MKSPLNLLGLVLLATALLAPNPSFAGSSDGKNRRVRVYNNTDTTVERFYASTTNQGEWQEDILGSDVISPGESLRINLDDGTNRCWYDLKVVFETGHKYTKYGVNVCSVSHIRIRARGITVD